MGLAMFKWLCEQGYLAGRCERASNMIFQSIVNGAIRTIDGYNA
jgi:hypothetical protein